MLTRHQRADDDRQSGLPDLARAVGSPILLALTLPGATIVSLAALALAFGDRAGQAATLLFAAIALGCMITGVVINRTRIRRLGEVIRFMIGMANRQKAGDIPAITDSDAIGDMARAIAVFRADAEEVELRGTELEEMLGRFDAALNHMVHGLLMLDAKNRVVLCNRQMRTLFGFDPDIVRAGATLDQVLVHSIAVGNHPGRSLQELTGAIQSRASNAVAAAFVQSLPDGRKLSVHWEPIKDGGWVCTYEDITARETAKATMTYMARHDAVTGLPNRKVLHDDLAQCLARGQNGGTGFSLLCIEIDRLDAVVKTRGHEAGNALIRLAAARLRNCVRDSDRIAHLGAATFTVVKPGDPTPEATAQLAARLCEVLSATYDIDGRPEVVSVSIGIATAATPCERSDELLRNATLALHRARADGGSTWRLFAQDMDRSAQDRHAMEMDLRGALAAKQFEVYYQPLVSVMQRRVTGFEALLRWHHPVRGMVSPAEFIPLAEELGLISSIGDWVLHTACNEAMKWPTDVRVAVNLSPLQFASPAAKEALARSVVNALAVSGLPGERLELEITESVRLQDDAATLALLHELRALGARISLDDFGTGYSSLSYLRCFPFDKIKIDQSFIRSLPANDSSAIVRAIAALGASLGIATTAEGVETRDQLAALVLDGCNEMQGYLFSPPRPAADVLALLITASSQVIAA